MSINPKIIAKLGRDGDGVTLEGTPKQIQWATSIRTAALELEWPPEIRKKLLLVKDSTWWIANAEIKTSMRFKEPSLKQLASSPQATGGGQPEALSPPAAHPSSDYIDGMTPLTGAPCMIPPRSPAAQQQIDRAEQKPDLEERVSDAEKWAASVSKNPTLAEAAIVSVLSRIYKDPMKSRLRALAWTKLGEAQDVFTKDADAIRLMLS